MARERSTSSPNPGVAVLWYRFRRALVEVRVHEPTLVDEASRLFRAHGCNPPGPGELPTRRLDLSARNAADRLLLSADDGASVAVQGRIPALEALEWALTETLTTAYADHVHVHAGGAVAHGGAVLVLGASEAGKSTLAFAWHRLGVPVLGDDVVLLDETGRAVAFRRAFKLDHTRLRAAGIDPTTTVGWYEGSPEAWFEPAGANAWAPRSPVRVIALSRVVPGTRVDMRKGPRREGLAALTGAVLASGRQATDAADALVAAAHDAQFVAIDFGDASAAAAALCSLAEGRS